MAKKQQHPDMMYFKNMALWLLAYKLFRDYLEILKEGFTPEPEMFFERWSKICLQTGEYSEYEVECIWKLFLDLLIARARNIK